MSQNKNYSLARSKVPELLARLIKKGDEVWGPMAGENGDDFFGRLSSEKELAGDYVNGYLGAKRFVFPQIEEMFRYKKNKSGLELSEPEAMPRAVIWGIRSCDMSAVNYFDSFFGQGAKSGPDWKSGDPLPDPLYEARRNRAVFITIGCNVAGPKCFCVCTDSGPFLAQGFDIQLTDLGDRYFAEVGSPKGEEFIKEFKEYFTPAQDGDQHARRNLENQAEKTFQQPISFFAKAMRRMDQGHLKPEFWQKVADYCIGCGGCIYVCPMCSCFDVDDRMESENEGMRYRSWDTCDFAGFTREVSGHNPRATRADRRKRWFYHKVSMDYLEKNPVIGCVGCGRCVIACPGGIDMPTVIRWMRKTDTVNPKY
jgi:ferredoxin